MIGAFIGDLAAWTWEHDHENFYPLLVSNAAQKSLYSDIMLFTAKTILDNPSITRDEFIHMHQHYYGHSNAKVNAYYDVLRSIIIGWLFDEKEISHAIHKFCLCDNKEEAYASHFLANLIFKLRNGATKKDAAQVEFCGTFRKFTKEKHRETGNGVLSYLVRAWISFYDAFDFGSSIHNAIKKSGDRRFNCILTGALADAMYGCDNYYVKKQFQGGCYLNKLPHLEDRIYQLNKSARKFYAKNNALTNVDRHYWFESECPIKDKVIDAELHRRILIAFQTGWEDRFGFYLDNGWIYVYRSHVLFARFMLTKQGNDTYKITNYQKSDESKNYDLDDAAIKNAMYSVEHRWDLISKD